MYLVSFQFGLFNYMINKVLSSSRDLHYNILNDKIQWQYANFQIH